MIVRLRDEDANALGEGSLLVHMGAGRPEDMIRSALRNYAAYKGLRGGGFGYFTVSTFAVAPGFDERRIVTTMRHGSFARVAAGSVRAAGFPILPTSLDDVGEGDLQELQQVHYDIVLPVADDPRHVGPPGAGVERLAADQLRPVVEHLLALMSERVDKYALYGRGDER